MTIDPVRRGLVCSLPLAPLVALTTSVGAIGPAAAQAGTWPSRPVRVLVGFPPGSTPDLAARILAEPLARAWGQPVTVENRPGASGNIAADAVAKATDEHTLGVVINGNLTSARLLNPRLPFDPASDFTLISLLATAPLVLVGPVSEPAGADFFKAAKAAGSKWSYGSVGIGSVGHLGMELLKARAGFEAVHVPYNGNPAVITAMIGGQVQAALVPPGVALPQVQAGKLRAIGVTGPASRLAPGVPPLTDAGVRLSELEVWTAVVAPATLPAAAKARLAADVPRLLREPETAGRLAAAGWETQGSTAEALATRVRSEAELLGGIIRSQGIRLE